MANKRIKTNKIKKNERVKKEEKEKEKRIVGRATSDKKKKQRNTKAFLFFKMVYNINTQKVLCSIRHNEKIRGSHHCLCLHIIYFELR